ncbi:ImmA/IrrE family metallo-endopeptidase [Virgibacillus sp. FSP13]
MTPNKIKVAGIDYEIKEVDGLADEHGLGGLILYEKGIIKIDSSMCKDKKEQVFVHELLHSIFNEAGYDEQNEDMVNRLSIVLYQVLKDNKLIF